MKPPIIRIKDQEGRVLFNMDAAMMIVAAFYGANARDHALRQGKSFRIEIEATEMNKHFGMSAEPAGDGTMRPAQVILGWDFEVQERGEDYDA